MRIFHNFDTELKINEYKECVEKFWQQRVLLIERCFPYWFFKWYVVVFFYLIVLVWVVFVMLWVYKYSEIVFYALSAFLFVLTFIFVRYIIDTYLHYKMDFALVTPDEIITYSQKWFLDSSYKSLPLGKIRSIKSYRSRFLWNIFWYWDIVFVSDWSSELAHPDGEEFWSWKVILTYVSKPNQIKKIIMDIANSWRYSHIQE